VVRAVVLSLLLMTSLARAEDLATYEAAGDAAATGADGRTEALDDAFARAAGQALDDIVPPDVRAAHKADLDREIIGHARLWVAKFTVTKDETTDQRRQLMVAVRVDRDKMRARLTELKLMTPAGPAPHSAIVLLRIASPDGVRASYGAGAEKAVAGLVAATAALKGAGYTIKHAPASGPAAANPLDDQAAEALAGDAKVEAAVIASVTVGSPTGVRGAPLPMALVTAHVKLLERTACGARSTPEKECGSIERTGKVIGEGSAQAVAGASADQAIDRALVAALGDVLPAAAHAIEKAGGFHGDDVPVAEAGIVLVRLPAKTPYMLVLAEQKHLQGAKGVTRATLRRIGPAGWVIGVATSEPADRIASVARKPPATGTTATAKLAGDVVEVALTGGTP
jgi:hypothetical protein